ncbi:hypothetical protein ACO0R3_003369 [Hanseniaspora guilliermondii]
MKFFDSIESINEVKYNDIAEIAAKTSLDELTEEEKIYIKKYKKKELKARSHLTDQMYYTIVALLFVKFYTFYESTFFLIIRLLATCGGYNVAKLARGAVKEYINSSESMQRLFENLQVSEQNTENILLDDDLTTYDSLDMSGNNVSAQEIDITNSIGDSQLPGSLEAQHLDNPVIDENVNSVTFVSNFGGINFRIQTNANFNINHEEINRNSTDEQTVRIRSIRKLKHLVEKALMRQFNKIVKLMIIPDLLMILFRILFPLKYDDFNVRRGYAFIDIISDYKKYPSFMNNNVWVLNIYNLMFEVILFCLHMILFQLICIENPNMNHLSKKVILAQHRCKAIMDYAKSKNIVLKDKEIEAHSKPLVAVETEPFKYLFKYS